MVQIMLVAPCDFREPAISEQIIHNLLLININERGKQRRGGN